MFLARGNRDLGFAFKTHPGSQASSRGEAKDSALLSSHDGISWSPLSGLKKSSLLWSLERGLGFGLQAIQEKKALIL